MLTFGAYIAFTFDVTLDTPLVVGVLAGVFATAAFGIASELIMWRPMRRKKAGMLQLLLMSLGLAFVLRNMIQFIWGARPRQLDSDRTSTVGWFEDLTGLTIGTTEMMVVIVSFVVLLAVAAMLRVSSAGRQMRALADNFDLAETTGIDTGRIVLLTWLLSGALAGLAGSPPGGCSGGPLAERRLLPPASAVRRRGPWRDRQRLRRLGRRSRHRSHRRNGRPSSSPPSGRSRSASSS